MRMAAVGTVAEVAAVGSDRVGLAAVGPLASCAVMAFGAEAFAGAPEGDGTAGVGIADAADEPLTSPAFVSSTPVWEA